MIAPILTSLNCPKVLEGKESQRFKNEDFEKIKKFF